MISKREPISGKAQTIPVFCDVMIAAFAQLGQPWVAAIILSYQNHVEIQPFGNFGSHIFATLVTLIASF
jgi:hypothetical protein